MTKFKKGESGNIKGRPKGAKNKKTVLWDDLGEWILKEGSTKFVEEMEKLNGKDYIKAYTSVLGYFKPKLKALDHTTKGGKIKPQQITGIIIQEIPERTTEEKHGK